MLRIDPSLRLWWWYGRVTLQRTGAVWQALKAVGAADGDDAAGRFERKYRLGPSLPVRARSPEC